jgi:hypothetical protein
MKENQKLIVKIMVAVSLTVTIILCTKFWHKHEVKNGIDTYGTYIMAAICKNGIVVGSDSRSVFVDSKNNVVAYFENSPKIFQIDNVLVSMSGKYSFDSTSFSQIFQDFKLINAEINVNTFYQLFIEFAKGKLSETHFKGLTANQFFICGYSTTNQPIINWYCGKDTVSIRNGYMTNTIKENKVEKVKDFLTKADCGATADFVKKSINLISKERNKTQVSFIGGDESIAYIDNAGVKWVHNQNNNDFKNSRGLAKQYLDGKVKMWFRSPYDSTYFRSNLVQILNKLR